MYNKYAVISFSEWLIGKISTQVLKTTQLEPVTGNRQLVTDLDSIIKNPMKYIIPILFFAAIQALAQENRLSVTGKVLDAKTKEPLANATIEVKARSLEMIAGTDGSFDFSLPATAAGDSIAISYLGYKTIKKRILDLKNPAIFLMNDYTVELRTITITSRNLNVKEIEKFLRPVRGNLYAYSKETTNAMYNLFLSYLEENGQSDLLKQCRYDMTGLDEAAAKWFREYTAPYRPPLDKKDTSVHDYTDFPAVRMSHGAAVVFCQWLTEQYNSHPGKRKFPRVKFRLPTHREWQIAALGYGKFQSWNLFENTVDVVIPDDTLTATFKGPKKKMPVTKDFLYPWWNHYHYRNKPINQKNCYLANFKAYPVKNACAWGRLPSYDGWFRMARTGSYFPNDMGLYDMVGNVWEMIDEKGKACGGSWNDPPEESTIHSVRSYKGADDSIGFRIFMEVIAEEK